MDTSDMLLDLCSVELCMVVASEMASRAVLEKGCQQLLDYLHGCLYGPRDGAAAEVLFSLFDGDEDGRHSLQEAARFEEATSGTVLDRHTWLKTCEEVGADPKEGLTFAHYTMLYNTQESSNPGHAMTLKAETDIRLCGPLQPHSAPTALCMPQTSSARLYIGKGQVALDDVQAILAEVSEVAENNNCIPNDDHTNDHGRRRRNRRRRRRDSAEDENGLPRTTHGLRTLKLKTAICRNWQNGTCNFGNSCGFAHGDADLATSPHVALDARRSVHWNTERQRN